MSKESEIRKLESELESISANLEGADLYSVLCMIADSQGDFMPDFLDSHLAGEMIRFTQSNPEESYKILKRMSEIDEEIAQLDEN
jgi:hypothetical protein